MWGLKKKKDNLPERRRRAPEEKQADTPLRSNAFKRGRTLTGSISSQVQSLSEPNADLKSPRVKAHILTRKRRRVGYAFLATLVFSGCFYIIIAQFTAHADARLADDLSIRLDKQYSEAIDSYMISHPLSRIRFLIDKDGMLSEIQESVPEVESISAVSSAGFGRSMFLLTMRRPIASWEVDGNQLYVDASGVSFGRNHFDDPGISIEDRSGLEATPGKTVTSNRFIGYIGQVIGLAHDQGYEVTSVTLPPGTTRQIEVRLEGVPYFIKLSSDRPVGEGVEDMVRTVNWMESRGVTAEYIDVRIEGRAFYR